MISLSNAKQFYKLWSAWLGDGGKPVPQQEAQQRANICLRCPLNKDKGLSHLIAEGAASIVHRQMEIKHRLRLHVEGEQNLHICDACDCVMNLKVWVPMKHILDNTDTKDLHENCWIRKAQ